MIKINLTKKEYYKNISCNDNLLDNLKYPSIFEKFEKFLRRNSKRIIYPKTKNIHLKMEKNTFL